MLRRFAVVAVGLLTLAVWVSSASAGKGGAESFGPEDWAVPAACGLDAGVTTVTLTGTSRWNSDESGAIHVTVNGTATDNLGNRYVFNYRNNYKGDPENGPLHMTDHFSLVGNGNGGKLNAGFNLVVDASGVTISFKERGGSQTLGCDPL